MGGAVGVGTGVDAAGGGGVGAGVEVADGEGTGEGIEVADGGGTGEGVEVADGGGTGEGVDVAGGGGVAVGASVAAGVTGAAVDCGDSTGPQAVVRRARTNIMSASIDDLETVLIISTLLSKNSHRLGSYCPG